MSEGRSSTAPAPMLGGDALGVHFVCIEDAARFLEAFRDLELAVWNAASQPATSTGC